MEEQVIHLTYPPGLLRKPIINEMIHRYPNLQVNILRANVTPNAGWLELQLVGTSAVIEDAIAWCHNLGIEVQTLGA